MPRRLITSEIFRNEKFGNLTDTGRVFFIGCFSNADDDGRLKASPKYLKALLFPYDNDKTPEQIKEIRDLCHSLGLLHIYNANGCEYLYCIGWGEHQVIRKDRHRPSVLPPPNSLMSTTLQPTDNHLSDTCQADVSPNLIQSNPIISNIYTVWNTHKIIVHQKLTEEIQRAITTALKDYSQEEIIVAIKNYAEIQKGEQYYFKYSWTLKDFLKRGLVKFLDIEIASKNYLRGDGNGAHQRDNTQGKREQIKPDEYRAKRQ